mmetsp:Transcript_102213/g.288767  ORF Transcript_102213/g.288767 Transcript_102213/m.288767 type:complete len:239 (+) Transcript_102213:1084-1800(+)
MRVVAIEPAIYVAELTPVLLERDFAIIQALPMPLLETLKTLFYVVDSSDELLVSPLGGLTHRDVLVVQGVHLCEPRLERLSMLLKVTDVQAQVDVVPHHLQILEILLLADHTFHVQHFLHLLHERVKVVRPAEPFCYHYVRQVLDVLLVTLRESFEARLRRRRDSGDGLLQFLDLGPELVIFGQRKLEPLLQKLHEGPPVPKATGEFLLAFFKRLHGHDEPIDRSSELDDAQRDLRDV